MEDELDELMGQAGFGKLDNVEFEIKEDYSVYFEYVKAAIITLNDHFKKKLSESPVQKVERTVVSYFLSRFRKSIDLLQLKNQFDPYRNVRLDFTESSFPNHAELRQMKADHKLRNQLLESLPNELVLKDKLLAKLRVQLEEPLEILHALSRRKYLNNLVPSGIYLMQNEGKLMEVGKAVNGRFNYVYCWATYDMRYNRPQIYVMDMQYSGNKVLDKLNPDYLKMKEIIDNISVGSKNIYEIVNFVDQELKTVHPKLLKKYDIGPIFGYFSEDEHPLTQFYKRHDLKLDEYLFYYEVEVVASVKEESIKAKWMDPGASLQSFFINKDNEECRKRKISEIHKNLIGPHDVIQLLFADEKVADTIRSYRNNIVAI